MARGNGSGTINANANTGNRVMDPSQDPSNPYYVHPGDGPSSVTVTPVLNGSNYHAWARSMRRALGGKNKFDFVDGSIEVPDISDPSYKAWSRCNMRVHSWIMNLVAESIGQSIVFLENAIDVWKDLKDRFSQGDLIKISELQQEIYSLRQGSRPVTEFYSELKILWEELETYMPMPCCACPVKCSCAAMHNARHYHHLNYAIRFLTGLNDNFAVVRSQILLMDPLPNINRIFSMMIQHERQNNYVISDESRVLINAAIDYKKSQGRGKGFVQGSGSRNSNKMCSYCGRSGHTVETCYRKHGFPPHMQRTAPVASNAVIDNLEHKEDMTLNEDSRSMTLAFTVEQYEKLINLIQGSCIQQPATSSSQVNICSQVGHSSTEKSKSGLEKSEDDWFW